ncbi:hypothetical protein [Curtobacterium sp. ISL-83]|uniref:hypothetical protein n=1 Tax=Curtobacterium sp. ISL-83 TaxID=2819145 RepID=UPI001BEAB6D1|nr:hypothetical protein [Curtobacterium sp. ISL-83]MBT2500929.1 hypothetical protein [Curtobacterium sp. ISL-83]
MQQSRVSAARRMASVGVAVAIVAASSAFGIGAVSAVAAPEASSTPASTTATPASTTPAPSTTHASTTARPAATTATPSATPTAAPLAFTEPSTQAAPLALTATVGTPFSHTFHTTGGNGTVAYAIQDAPSAAYTVNVETGVLSGTPPTAGTFTFEVVALSGSTQVTEYVRLTVAQAPLAFTEPSTKTTPLQLTATAGVPFSHTFHTTGGNGTVGYALQAEPKHDFSVNVDTGVLSGSTTEAGVQDLQVVALSGGTQVTEWVQLTVKPAAPVGVLTIVGTGSANANAWEVAPNGTITQYGPGETKEQTVTSIPAQQGSTLYVSGLAVDRFGNRTTPWTGAGVPMSTVTSSVASDRITWLPSKYSSSVTFVHASPHTITIREGGATTSFLVTVQPTVVTIAAGSGGELAYTGADVSGPLTGAVGLLLGGIALLIHRLRRRRV